MNIIAEFIDEKNCNGLNIKGIYWNKYYIIIRA